MPLLTASSLRVDQVQAICVMKSWWVIVMTRARPDRRGIDQLGLDLPNHLLGEINASRIKCFGESRELTVSQKCPIEVHQTLEGKFGCL